MGLFAVCNHITGIISLLVVRDLSIWYKRSVFARALDITGKTD